jgi:hypothetical protein
LLDFLGLTLSSTCRKGFDISRNNFAVNLPQILNRIGNFGAAITPGDSNIIDVSGNPGPFSGSSYVSAKNTAISRGWSIKES